MEERLGGRMRGLGALRPAEAARGLLLTGEPDPRLLQGSLVMFVLVDFAVRDAFTAQVTWPMTGLALTVVVWALTFALPWARLPLAAHALVPLFDIAALGLVRLTPSGSAAGILVVVPALWLGRQFGRRGALLGALAVLVLASGPGLAVHGVTSLELSRALMIAVIAGWVGLAVALGLERVRIERDEAERRRVELAEALAVIEHQRRVSEAILDTVDVGLVLLDRSGGYTGMNRRHRDFMRLAFPQGHGGVAGQLGMVFGPDGQTPLTREQMPSFRATRGEEFDDERIWVGEDPRTRRALSVSSRSVRDPHGELVGAALAYKDVTDFMQALQVKDEFVASVSHELRTPLTSIVGYLQLLLEREDLDPQALDQLHVVERNADRLRRLVGDLLHTAQLDEGTVKLVRAPQDLAEIVRECVRAAEPAARQAGIELTCATPETLTTLVDGERFAQVVDNLLSNAVKYTLPGGRVDVALTQDGSRVELSVRDSGIGIAPADRKLLFQRFFRSREAEERSIQGVGLGLSIAKAIVEGHGGRIEVESELGRGSVFRIRLPIDQQPARAVPSA
ncbi:sensor histidine kinase [Nocardioides ferulae]|uniref:sensor histidine kinase n=1 Tax=Nocardioides ferulae TaxID=2340821 RepID=UPI000F87BBCF|nr:HAMP domain-containing sensor histidine kinase [Nocardioides ferulae]